MSADATTSPTSSDSLDLSRFDDDFAEAKVETRELDEVPDGKYQVTVHKVELTRAHKTGNPMLKWTLRILAGPSANRLLWRNNVMASRDNIRFLKTDLHTCGLDLEKLSDLPANLERLLDVKLEVTKKTRDDHSNVYFNRRIVLAEDLPSTGSDDLTPF